MSLKLNPVSLAYARAIAAIELRFHRHSHEDGDCYEDAQAIVRQLQIRGMGLDRSWRQEIPLIDLYDFSLVERDLLLDLADNGGFIVGRRADPRFVGLGSGEAGKKAVVVSTQYDRWTTRLTKRGEELVEAFRKENGHGA